MVVTTLIGHGVIATIAEVDVVADAAVHQRLVLASAQHVITGTTVQFIAAGTTIKLIITLIAGEFIPVVVIIAGIEQVIACATVQFVFALAGIKLVITTGESFGHGYGIIAIHGVITIIAMHFVIPGLTGHPVIACATMQRVVAHALYPVSCHHAGAFPRFDGEILVIVAPCPLKSNVAGYCNSRVIEIPGRTIREPALFKRLLAIGEIVEHTGRHIVGITQNQIITCTRADGVVACTTCQYVFFGTADNGVATMLTTNPVAAFFGFRQCAFIW